MSNIGNDAAFDHLTEERQVAQGAHAALSVGDDTPSTVRTALESLGADLDDAYSRDPTNFYANLRGDALKSALLRLLGSLRADKALALLDWMATTNREPGGPSLIAGLDSTAEVAKLVEAHRRRRLFNRLMSPQRLAQLLSACMGDTAAEAA